MKFFEKRKNINNDKFSSIKEKVKSILGNEAFIIIFILFTILMSSLVIPANANTTFHNYKGEIRSVCKDIHNLSSDILHLKRVENKNENHKLLLSSLQESLEEKKDEYTKSMEDATQYFVDNRDEITESANVYGNKISNIAFLSEDLSDCLYPQNAY